MTFLNQLWAKVSTQVFSAKNSSAAALSSGSFSANPAKIASLLNATSALGTLTDQHLPLRQLQAQRQIIEINISGSSQPYQTLILAIDCERNLLWVDDLFPTPRALKIGDVVSLRHHRNGELLGFSSPVVAWGDSFGANGMAILLPEFLSYQPRRQFPRCDLSQSPALTVKIRPVGHNNSFGNLQDLSLGGLSLRVSGNLLGQLRHGALLPVCELSLSDELLIRCSARIRAFRMAREPHRCTHISAEFVDMSAERKLQLQQFIYQFTHAQSSQTLVPNIEQPIELALEKPLEKSLEKSLEKRIGQPLEQPLVHRIAQANEDSIEYALERSLERSAFLLRSA